MPTCQLCKHDFRSLRFNTEHIGICLGCVNTLNNSQSQRARRKLASAELLARGMRRNASRIFCSMSRVCVFEQSEPLAISKQLMLAHCPVGSTGFLENTDNAT